MSTYGIILYRIHELEEFKKKAKHSVESVTGKPFVHGCDWFHVPDRLFDKYHIDKEIVSDKYFIGEVIDRIISELKMVLERDT